MNKPLLKPAMAVAAATTAAKAAAKTAANASPTRPIAAKGAAAQGASGAAAKGTAAKSAAKSAATQPPVKRSPGRPRKSDDGGARHPALSPATIIETAFGLCREVPLADLSIVQLAKALDVAPATLHYYLDGRDALLAGVIARYFEHLLPCFEIGRGQPWERRVRAVARALYDQQVKYHGVNSYFIAHNRFRLIQSDAPGVEAPGAGDNGVRFLEAMLRLFREKPFSVRCAVANSHALVRFLCSSAHSARGRQLPGQHRRFIRDQLSRTDPIEFAAVHECLDEFVHLGADEAFETGLSILIRGFLDDTQ